MNEGILPMGKLNVNGTEIQVLQIEEDDDISLTDAQIFYALMITGRHTLSGSKVRNFSLCVLFFIRQF